MIRAFFEPSSISSTNEVFISVVFVLFIKSLCYAAEGIVNVSGIPENDSNDKTKLTVYAKIINLSTNNILK